MTMRFRVESRDVPAAAAAKRLGLTLDEFTRVADRLYGRGFPRADPDTDRFDLEAIDQWMHRRNGHLFGIAQESRARNADDVVRRRLGK